VDDNLLGHITIYIERSILINYLGVKNSYLKAEECATAPEQKELHSAQDQDQDVLSQASLSPSAYYPGPTAELELRGIDAASSCMD
jgi:hypothetical protein